MRATIYTIRGNPTTIYHSAVCQEDTTRTRDEQIRDHAVRTALALLDPTATFLSL